MTDVKQLITEHLDIWLTAETEKKSGRGRSSGSNDTIYGVKKLRQLIMDLAIQGKLVRMNPNDSDVIKFIDEIFEHKKIVSIQNKKVKVVTSKKINDKDLPFCVPNHWSWVRFGDITINRDAERVPLSTTVRETKKGPYDYYGASGVIDHVDDYLFDKTLLLIGEDGANLLSRTTPIAFFATGKYWVNNHAHVIDGISENFLNYIRLFINAIDLSPYVTGTAQPKMNQAKMNEILVALPPPEEQQRIVEKVDELMQLCDQLEQQQTLSTDAHATLVDTLLKALTESNDADEFQGNWQLIVANFDLLFTTEYSIEQLKQTVLQLAVMGKLVKQDPSDEPASELLKKIADEKAKLIKEGKIKKSKPLPEISEDEKPFELPSGWEWTRVGNISQLIEYGTSFKTNDTDAVPVYRMGNIQDGLLIDDNFKYLPETCDDLPRLYLNSGDILFNRTNSYELVGKSAVYTGIDDYSTFASYLIRIRLMKSILPVFVNYAINSPYYRSTQIEPEITQQCGQANFNGTKLALTIIPLPSPAMQNKIINKLEEIYSLIDQLKKLNNRLMKKKIHLADALVANAVEGV